MKQTVNFNEFCHAFHAHDRYDQFGYAALRALFDYLEDLEQDYGKEFELDVIALCCDWTRFDSAVDACKELAAAGEPVEETEEDAEEQCLEWLQDQTSVIEFSASPTGKGGILVMAF